MKAPATPPSKKAPGTPPKMGPFVCGHGRHRSILAAEMMLEAMSLHEPTAAGSAAAVEPTAAGSAAAVEGAMLIELTEADID